LGQVKIQFQGLLSEIGLTKLQLLLCSVDLISKQLCLCYSVVYVCGRMSSVSLWCHVLWLNGAS